MDKQQRYELYKYSVGPGWWNFLDRYIPKIKKVDPDAELHLKEKFGTARLRIESKKIPATAFYELQDQIELESSELCENCGSPARIRYVRGWYKALCVRCNGLNDNAKEKICEETERHWLGSAEDFFISDFVFL